MAFLTLRERFKIPTYDNTRHMRWADISFNLEKCNQCGVCITACAAGAIVTDNCSRADIMAGTVKGKAGIPHLKKSSIGTQMCAGCLTCAAACPREAITIMRSFRPGYHYKRLTQAEEMTYPKRY